jgi:hypothetical protein
VILRSASSIEQAQNLQQAWQIYLNNLPVGCGISHYENGILCVDNVNDGVLLIPYITPEIINASHEGHISLTLSMKKTARLLLLNVNV